MALVRKTVDLDPEHADYLVKSYIETYPDWIFDDGTFVEIAERIHSSAMDVDTLLINMYNQVVKETDEARKKKLVDKAFEWALRDDNLKNFYSLDRLLLDHDKKRYAAHPGRKLQLEKDLKRHEEAEIYDWVYRRTKYALEHFGEGDEAFEMLYNMDTDPKLRDGEWERAEREKRLKEGFEEAEKRGIDLSTVWARNYTKNINLLKQVTKNKKHSMPHLNPSKHKLRSNNPSTQPELFPAVLSRAAGSGANRTALPVITPQLGTPATGRPEDSPRQAPGRKSAVERLVSGLVGWGW